MSQTAIAKMAAKYPLPIFSTAGEVAEVTIAGQIYVFVSTDAPDAPGGITGGLKEFTIFNKLPREIRTKIWGHSVEGRIITAVEMPEQQQQQQQEPDTNSSGYENTGGEANPIDSFHFIGAGYPLIFQVCKEVKKLAGGMGYKKSFEVKGSSKVVYFNPNVDTLVLDTAIRRRGFLKQVPLSKALVDPIDLKSIQTLRIQLPSFVVHYDNVIGDIKAMASLRDLTLVGSCDVFPTQPGLTLKLRYDFDGKMAIPSARSQLSVPLIGKDMIVSSPETYAQSRKLTLD